MKYFPYQMFLWRLGHWYYAVVLKAKGGCKTSINTISVQNQDLKGGRQKESLRRLLNSLKDYLIWQEHRLWKREKKKKQTKNKKFRSVRRVNKT